MAGLIVVSIASVGSGTTRRRYRRVLAEALGFWQEAVTTATATQGEAARMVFAEELRDDEAGLPFLGAPWVYVRTGAQADTQRRFVSQFGVGYQGPLGALMVSRPFSAALASGVSIEVTNPLPVKRHLAIAGLNECVNEALGRTWVEVVLAVTGNGTYEYDLAPTPYLQADWQLRGVYDRLWGDTGTTAPELAATDTRIVADGAERTLVLDRAYDSGSTFYLHAIVRGDAVVYDGSSWTYPTEPGLQGDDWQAAVPESWVRAFGMVMATREAMKVAMADREMDKDERNLALADLDRRRQQWARTALAIKRTQFPKPLAARRDGLIGAGAPSAWA